MSRRPKIVVTDFVFEPLEIERQVIADAADVVALQATDESQLIGCIEDADAIMLYHSLAITRKTIERLQHCKLIVRCGAGYDNVDHAFAAGCNIKVANVPDYGIEEVADSAIAMTMALTRGVTRLNSLLRAGIEPWSYTQAAPLQRLRGQVFAIVGLGRIGSAAAQRAKALGMDVVFYDPYKPDGYDKAMGIRRTATFPQLLEQAYVLSLHCPLTDETRHMVNAETLNHMPMGSFLVNTARGAVVNTDAIPDAVAAGRLAGAAIDVLETEPPDNSDPLIVAWRDPDHLAHHRVIINPHSAFYCQQGLAELRAKSARACLDAVLGRPLRNVIN